MGRGVRPAWRDSPDVLKELFAVFFTISDVWSRFTGSDGCSFRTCIYTRACVLQASGLLQKHFKTVRTLFTQHASDLHDDVRHMVIK